MWGLGLFFSVQMTFMFGLEGLLMFAVPNALGLMLFGFLTQIVAKKHSGGQESLALFFDKFSKPFRFILYIYQIVALSLTVFALVSYLVVPLLDMKMHWALMVMYKGLIVFVILAVGSLFGEEFGLQKIKASHAVMGSLLVVCVATILLGLQPLIPEKLQWTANFPEAWKGPSFLGYAIPLVIGLLVGPWLDLQHWQRAIQIHREKTSIRASYFWGGLIFFLMLLFHGCLAFWVMSKQGELPQLSAGLDKFNYAHDLVTRYFSLPSFKGSIIPFAYFSFLVICAITTLDSGYVALKWFLEKNVEKSENMLLSLIPRQILGSPIPTFLVVGAVTLVGIFAKFELEYFMVFYASFFVGYAALAIARCYVPNAQHPLPQIKMLMMAIVSLAIFAFGYLTRSTPFMISGSILPLIYVIWLVFNADLLRVVTERAGEVIGAAAEIPAIKAITKTVNAATAADVVAPQDGHALGGHFEDKWFVYSMIATYQDTNSVGNVYFGMYGLFVGKTRELFFNVAMPDFDLKTTKFYILTRSFEHKFVREAREFDTITVKIRVADFNRKFCTLEHQIFGPENVLLGKGKQSLLFVSSKDYSLLDIPPEVYTAFMKYL